MDFTDATLDAVREFHSLGLVLPKGARATPQNLRTLALTYRSLIAVSEAAGAKAKLHPKFEFVFIHARPTADSMKRLDLYAFATSEERKVFHWLDAWEAPRYPKDCSVHAYVLFTEYSSLGLIPRKSATRQVTYRSKQVIPVSELNDLVQQQGWKGDVWDHLGWVLNAVIEGRLQP